MSGWLRSATSPARASAHSPALCRPANARGFTLAARKAINAGSAMANASVSHSPDTGSGSLLGDLVCGGQGSDAPEPVPQAANACSDVRLVMPGFFKLLEDPSKPLDGLRQAVKTLGTPTCPTAPRACTADTSCPVGDY